MGFLWFLATLPCRAVAGAAVFLWVVCTGDTSGRDADAERGRWNAIGPWHPDRHKVTPAIGRKGWRKR